MKTNLRTLALCLVLGTSFTAITSCNNDDGIEEVVKNKKNKYTYSPPAWIHGEWVSAINYDNVWEELGISSMKFTANKIYSGLFLQKSVIEITDKKIDKKREVIDDKEKTYTIATGERGETTMVFNYIEDNVIKITVIDEGPGNVSGHYLIRASEPLKIIKFE